MLTNLFYMFGFLAFNTLAFAFLEKKISLGKSFFCDLTFGLINPLLVTSFINFSLKFFFLKTQIWGLVNLPELVSIFILFPLIIVFADLWGYGWHLIYHHTIFWRLHFIHHSTKDLRWHSILRFHPLETILTHASLFIILGIFGIPFQNFVILNIAIFIFSALSHSKVNWNFGVLGKIFVSPAYHSIHHQQKTQDKNLGLMFVWWDQLLGKRLLTNNIEKGAEASESRDSWFKLLIHPFLIK